MAGRRRITQLSTGLQLFVYDLDLLIDHLPGKPINGYVHPIVLLAFDEKARKSRSSWRIASALSYYIDQEIPGARLGCVRKGADD